MALLSFEDYGVILDNWIASLPPEQQRKYQPKTRRQARRAPNVASELHDEAGTRTNFELAGRASIALGRISTDRCDQYDTWVAVGMALSELGRVGYVLWDEWSKGSAKYDPTACAEKWPTFTPGDGLTLASLHAWAGEDDPRETPTDGCTPDCPNRAKVTAHQATIRQLEKECGELRERNQFVTNAQAARHIKSASLRDTVVELKKELDRVPLEERQPDQFVRIRPALMATFANSSPSTVSRHLRRLEDHSLIERRVERAYDPEQDAWVSETFVKPLVDLTDPNVLVVPSEHGGDRRQRCTTCNSDKLVREIKVYCAECETVQSADVELVNPPEEAAKSSELQDALQTVAQEMNGDSPLNCILRDKELTIQESTHGEDLSELQDAIQHPEGTPAAARPGTQLSLIDVSDPATLPGVRAGRIAADDPWIVLQQQLAARRSSP